MDLVKKTKEYFLFFSNKEIKKLELIYDDDVNLKDWEIDVRGKENVLRANEDTFKKVDSIYIKPIRIISEGNYTFSQIEILIDKDIILDVIDVIRFTEQSQIDLIRAYKG